jgi:hypothetical protein
MTLLAIWFLGVKIATITAALTVIMVRYLDHERSDQ